MNENAANDHGQLPANNRHALRRVARACRKAALSTVLADGSGAPYVSLVTVAFDHDLAPILLLSGLSEHTRCLSADPRVALLLDGTDGLENPQTGPRVTLTGIASRTEDERLKRRFLARHPSASLYAGFGDFGFWRVEPLRAHFVGGFGRAVWFDAPFGLAAATVQAFAAAEDALAQAVEGAATGAKVVSADPDGCDILLAEGTRWVPFPTPVERPEGLAPAAGATSFGVNP